MEHIVGVPKREPCKHCGLPIFFAERLAIDGSFYHRKCLRCARCDTQLTVGSFYETESGAYVCETCPDEEKKIQIGNNNSVGHFSELSPQVADEHRKSFSEKLAMFQSNGKGLLQKSLSDEEKTKSLKRLTELYSKNCTHDANDIKHTINEFDDVQIDEQNDDDDYGGGSAAATAELSTSGSSDEEDDKPPSLPKTLPPTLNLPTIDATKPKLPPIPSKANVFIKLYGKNVMDKVHQDNVKIDDSTSSQKLQTTAKSSIDTNEQSSYIEQQQNDDNSAKIKENYKETPSPIGASVLQNQETVNAIESNHNTNNSLPLDALNSLTNVTKENAEFIAANQNNNANVHHLGENKRDSNGIDNDNTSDNRHVEQDTNTENVSQLELNRFVMDEHIIIEQKQEQEHEQTEQKEQEQQSPSNNECKENKSIDTNNDNTNNHESITNISDNDSQKMVRSRLSQFEALLQSTEKKQTPHYTPRSNRSSAFAENMTMQNEQKKSIEVNGKLNVTTAADLIVQSNVEQEPLTQFSLNADDENIVSNSNADSSKILSTSEINDIHVERPVPRQRATLNVRLEEVANNLIADSPPTPSKRKQKPTTSEFEPLDDKHQLVEDNSNNLENEHKRLSDCSMKSENNVHKKDEMKYPNGLNPFGSDDDNDDDGDDDDEKYEPNDGGDQVDRKRKKNLNPFDSDDDEIELLKKTKPKKIPTNHGISTNPFGSDSENETDNDSLSAKRKPVPTLRKRINGSMLHETTSEASPRMYNTLHPKMRLHTGDNFHGSNASLASSTNNIRISSTLNRSSKVHGSMSSLASSVTLRHKKGRAPDIPKVSVSASSSPSHSIRATPITRKKRAAPLPPANKHQSNASSNYLTAGLTLEEDNLGSRHTISSESVVDFHQSDFVPSIASSYVSSSNEMSISSTEPNNLSAEFKSNEISSDQMNESTPIKSIETTNVQRKLIPVDESLLDDLVTNQNSDEMSAEEKGTYRRKIIPDQIITPIKSVVVTTDRQCEKMKENKESQNKNRQSQIVMPSNVMEEASRVYSPNKSSYGKWKRRKGPAPSLPIPPRKVIQMLPLQEIRHELEVIEVQQQGLEKQGIMLEKMIRERCEGAENDNQPLNEFKPNSKEVEDLILQLFELVNEKNELFRRQAELMYLRRQHRLEQEQADIEYEIRVLMAQPECNKTDSDKSREEALILHLIDVVQLRNEVIESLEMDRIREAEEDQSIKQRLEMHTAKRDEELSQQTPVKLSKKEKKKQKESKKLAKQKKMDADKDADESEISQSEKSKDKKKKKKFLF